jgi:hypothetical protein
VSSHVTFQLTQPHFPCDHLTVMVTIMTEQTTIRVGDRVYLRNCVAGEPGVVVCIVRGKFGVEWPDMSEVGRTFHHAADLELDAGFHVHAPGLDFEEVAA